MKFILFIIIMSSSFAMLAQEPIILNGIQENNIHFYVGFPKVTEQFNYIQTAQKFSTEKTGCMLQRVELGRLVIRVNLGEASVGEPTKAIFMLKVYDIDSLTGGPGASLTEEELKITDRKNTIVSIDLRKYKIIIPGKDFFVGIEWLTTKQNQRLIELFDRIELTPGKSFRKVGQIYEPFVGMVKNQKTTSDAWVMTPEGEWKLYTHNMPYMTDLAISAHILPR